jgi:hypothetical protein
MYAARLNKENMAKIQERAPGSGNIWKNQITVPKPPKLAERAYSNQNKVLKPVTPKTIL